MRVALNLRAAIALPVVAHTAVGVVARVVRPELALTAVPNTGHCVLY